MPRGKQQSKGYLYSSGGKGGSGAGGLFSKQGNMSLDPNYTSAQNTQDIQNAVGSDEYPMLPEEQAALSRGPMKDTRSKFLGIIPMGQNTAQLTNQSILAQQGQQAALAPGAYEQFSAQQNLLSKLNRNNALAEQQGLTEQMKTREANTIQLQQDEKDKTSAEKYGAYQTYLKSVNSPDTIDLSGQSSIQPSANTNIAPLNFDSPLNNTSRGKQLEAIYGNTPYATGIPDAEANRYRQLLSRNQSNTGLIAQAQNAPLTIDTANIAAKSGNVGAQNELTQGQLFSKTLANPEYAKAVTAGNIGAAYNKGNLEVGSGSTIFSPRSGGIELTGAMPSSDLKTVGAVPYTDPTTGKETMVGGTTHAIGKRIPASIRPYNFDAMAPPSADEGNTFNGRGTNTIPTSATGTNSIPPAINSLLSKSGINTTNLDPALIQQIQQLLSKPQTKKKSGWDKYVESLK